MNSRLLLYLLMMLLFIPFSFSQEESTFIQQRIDSAEVIRKKGNLNQAIQLLETTLAQSLAEIESTDIKLAILYHKLGVYYYRYGDLAPAETNTQKAIQIRLATIGAQNAPIARAYFLLGAINRGQGKIILAKRNVATAISAMEGSLETLPNKADSTRLGNMYVEYMLINRREKDYSNALIYWNKAFQLFESKSSGLNYQIANLYRLKGILYDVQEQYAKAQENFLLSNSIFDQLEGNWEAPRAGNFYNLAISYRKSGALRDAKRFFQRALKTYENIYEKKQRPYYLQEIVKINSSMVKLYDLLDDNQKLNYHFENGLKEAQKAYQTRYHPVIAELYQHRGAAQLKKQDYLEAMKTFQTAVKSLVPSFKPDDPFQNPNLSKAVLPNKAELLQLFQYKAQALSGLYKEEKQVQYLGFAFQTYRSIDTLITQIRQGFQAPGSRYLLQEKAVTSYEQAISTALQLYTVHEEVDYLEAAYYFSAKNKALVLLEGLQDEQAKKFGGIPSPLLEQENQLKKNSYDLQVAIYEAQQDQKDSLQQILQDSLFEVRRAYTKLIDRFEKEFPSYYELKYQYTRPIEVKELQQSIPDQTLLVEYFIGEKTIFIFTISSTGLKSYTFTKPDNFNALCIDFRKASDGSLPNSRTTHLELGYLLFDQLLAKPLANEEENNPIDRLIIIPDDVLLHLSFDALLYAPTETWDRLENPYLLKKYALSYAYSNQLIFDLEKKARIQQSLKGFAGFGLEYDDYTLEGLSKLNKLKGDSIIPKRAAGKLLYSDDEVLEIADLLGGQHWLNKAATKRAFLENANKYKVLHMAMHGVANEENPLNSALIFTRTTDSLDYLLRASDLYAIPLYADMVVLSACNTGYGKLNRGEGVRSLARAFSYAGCPSLVATLWEAPDKASKDILVTFYENLKNGMPKDKALQKAKLNYLQNAAPAFSDPIFWSHLVIIGNAETISFDEGIVPSWIWLSLGLLIGLIFIATRIVKS